LNEIFLKHYDFEVKDSNGRIVLIILVNNEVMKLNRHQIRLLAISISLAAAIFIITTTAKGWGRGGCDGGLCVFNLIGPFFWGLITFFSVFYVTIKILDKD
jgi:hypothetical protein